MATARLPGIYFETVAPPVPALLPRMDIAAFAGFLPSGPVGLPVVVEDADRFAEIFGTDLPLAWDNQSSQMLMAQTPPAVRTFFRNGGRRCWVLRLANDAQANAWIVPGLLQVDSFGSLEAGWIQARSQGSWSDQLTVNATLLESPLPAGALDTSGSTPRVLAGFNSGDTVQLYYQSTGTLAFHTYSDPRWFWFQAVQPGDVTACGSVPIQPDFVTLLGPGVSTQLPVQSFCAHGSELLLTLSRDPAPSVAPGSWLKIELSGRTMLLQVESIEAAGPIFTASPPASEQYALMSSQAWWVVDADSAWAANRNLPVQVSTVEFELWAMPQDAPTLSIADLGLAHDNARYWGLLPDDLTLYAPVDRPAALPYSALASEIDHPRFPLAGVNSSAFGIPLGMTALLRDDFTQAASQPGATALDRDGLANFDLSLFVDPLLEGSNSTTLLQDAYSLQYQAQTPHKPGGLFALLEVDEPSMLAVPDASLNGWYRASVQTTVLAAPDPLIVSAPSAGGTYTVTWANVPGATEYLLQSSTDLTFETGTIDLDAGTALSVSLQDAPECPQQLYYRVSAYGLAGSGPWSSTASVHLGTGNFSLCSQLPLNAPQLLLIEEPDRVLLEWIPAPGGFDGFTLEIAEDPRFISAAKLYSGNETGFQYWQVPGPPSYFRVNTQLGDTVSAWSNTVSTTPAPVSPWFVNSTSVAPLMTAIHAAMLRIAAARADMVAILSLPVSYRGYDAAAYPARLTQAIQAREDIGRILSYAAIYHPWLVVRDSTAPPPVSLRTIAPDGAVCGAIATTTLASGAWIAPANVALQNVLALQPNLPGSAAALFDLNQINLIAQQPEGFLITNQNTLMTLDPDLEPLNVRRLLILIRRLALREGVQYVFENISPILQRQVTRQFEGWMQQMLSRGAFAGLSAADSYRVIADRSVNPQESIDQGRFIVQLQVAPSVPMRFLTVQLMQSGGELSLSER